MDPNALTLFADIVDAGNLSEAARRLKMSRANVSYRLNQFERDLGQQLLRRTTRRIEPTEIGQTLYAHGVAVRNVLAEADESVVALGRGLHGRVRLSVPTGYGQMVMTDWLVAFKRDYPGIMLDVVFENRVADLLQGEIDLAVRVMSEPPPNLVARNLGVVRYVACATPAYARAHGMPVTLEALRQAPLITSAVIGRHLRVAAYQDDERREVMLEPTVVSENFTFLRACVLGDLGVAIVPDYVVRDDVAGGALVTTLDEWRLSIFGNHMYLLYMRNQHHTRAAATLIDHLLRCARGG